MKFKSSATFFWGILSLSLIFLSCEKEQINDSDKSFPLDLSVQQDGKNVKLSWTKVENSRFNQYLIYSSPDSVPADFVPTPFDTGVKAVFRNPDSIEYTDREVLLNPSVYYRVYADIELRTLSSPSKKVDYEFQFLEFDVTETRLHPHEPLLFLFVQNNKTLYVYDFEKNQILSNRSFSIGSPGFKIGRRNTMNEYEVFFSERNTNNCIVMDARTLEEKTVFTGNDICIDCIGSVHGYTILATDHFSHPIQTFSEEGLLLDESGKFDHTAREIYTYGQTSNVTEIFDMSPWVVSVYKFDKEGNEIFCDAASWSITPTRDLARSKLYLYFIGNTQGIIWNRTLAEFGRLPELSFNESYLSYAFSKDDEYLFAVKSGLTENTIQVFSFPGLDMINELEFRYEPYQIYRIRQNELLIIGHYFSPDGLRHTVFDFLDID